MKFRDLLNEASNTLNVDNVSLEKAKKYAASEFKKDNKDLDGLLDSFDKNYKLIQKKLKKAKDIPRIDMPVIKSTDMKEFQKKLESGSIDIFEPLAKKEWDALKIKTQFPKDLDSSKGKDWVNLGRKDGDIKDDVIKTKLTKMSAKELLPSQNQIWLEVMVKGLLKFGKVKPNSFTTKKTIIVTKDKYILDGHHRWAQVMLSDPNIKMDVLFVPIKFDSLAKIARSYGNAIGRTQNQ